MTYQSQFTEHQLCWAHFLRKAIALSLRNPDNREYARFLKLLFAVYYDAVRSSRDRRLSVGRPAKVQELQARIRRICRRYGEVLDETAAADKGKFVLLQNELVDHLEKLFVFVLHPEVEATNTGKRVERFRRRPRPPSWHAAFLKMLPVIERHSRVIFPDRDSEKPDKLVQATIVNCLAAFARLLDRGKTDVAFAIPPAPHAVRQVADQPFRKVLAVAISSVAECSSPYLAYPSRMV